MARTTKVVGFSIPPQTYQKLENLIKQKQQTRSEFFRRMIDIYFESLKEGQTEATQSTATGENDLAKILQSYWLLRSKTKLRTITIGLAIIENDNKVLIGQRKGRDKWVKNLSWVFPGGAMESLDFESKLAEEVKIETGLDVKINSIVDARLHPGSMHKEVQIVALYFHCKVLKRKKLKPGGDLVKLKWVNPTDVFKYFTTSTSDNVTKFLVAHS